MRFQGASNENYIFLEALHAIWIYVVCLSAANIGGTD